MGHIALDELADYLDLIAAHFAAAAERSEASTMVIAAHDRIAGRIGSPIQDLRSRVGLTETEVLAFVTLAGLELDERIRLHLLREGAALVGVRAELLRRVIYGRTRSPAAAHQLSREGSLMQYGLVGERTDGAGVVHLSATQHGLDVLQGRRISGLQGLEKHCVDVADWIAGAPKEGDGQLARAIAGGRECIVLVCSPAGYGRRSLIEIAATQARRGILVVDVPKMTRDDATVRDQCRAIALESRMRNAVLVLADLDKVARPEITAVVAEVLVPLIDGPIVATCSEHKPKLDWGRPVVTMEMGKPSTKELARLWHEKLGQGTPEDGQRLAEQYPLAPALIHHAAEAARARAGERLLEPEDIYAGIRSVLDDRLGQYAKRVQVTQRWNDVVLPQEQVDTIIELVARVRRRSKVYEQWGFAAKVGRGLGVSALFSGPPGTGKTMIAGLIAIDLGLELYQVDMAKVVSKFIGETEKNLGALFDAAEAGHAILLFDEADALFGKRTEVKSSNDRYANLETNYLLQRLETYTGVCLLTSNHESNIDPAFQRRLSLHLRFELPDEDERALLWKATLPEEAPVAGDIDFASLGRRFAMSGGYIRNATLRAAFLAADEGASITAAHLERAARVEYEGMGKIAA